MARSRWRGGLLVGALLVTSVVGCSSHTGSSGDGVARRPNIVFILTDDMRADAVGQLPALAARRDLARFDRNYVELPQCCPSRATTLTGRYSFHTHVDSLVTGGELDDSKTVATMLHAGGYRTGLFGKYLNGYPFGRTPFVPPGWDEFDAYHGSTNYLGYTLFENGHDRRYGDRPADYSTDVLTAKAISFIRSTKTSQPFFAYIPYNAPHLDAKGKVVPRAADVGVCNGHLPRRLPSFNATDPGGEPPWMLRTKQLGPLRLATTQELVRTTCEALHSVDTSISAIFAELQREHRLDNTYVVFASDNGYSFGEHRLCCKGHLYEESVHVPLLVRGPHVVPGAIHRLTSNIDLAPTLLDWAGITPPKGFMDGTSFAPNLRRAPNASEPSAVLLRGCRTAAAKGGTGEEASSAGGPACGGHNDPMPRNWGLRTDRYKYIEYPDGFVQLFDLRRDPYELLNLGRDAAEQPVIKALHAQLVRMRSAPP